MRMQRRQFGVETSVARISRHANGEHALEPAGWESQQCVDVLTVRWIDLDAEGDVEPQAVNVDSCGGDPGADVRRGERFAWGEDAQLRMRLCVEAFARIERGGHRGWRAVRCQRGGALRVNASDDGGDDAKGCENGDAH